MTPETARTILQSATGQALWAVRTRTSRTGRKSWAVLSIEGGARIQDVSLVFANATGLRGDHVYGYVVDDFDQLTTAAARLGLSLSEA